MNYLKNLNRVREAENYGPKQKSFLIFDNNEH